MVRRSLILDSSEIEEKELARVQRKLSKAPKGTPERKKALKVVERVHERIANKRYEFAHQVSRDLVNRFGFIAFEDLNIKNMLQKPLPCQIHLGCGLEYAGDCDIVQS